MTFVMTQPQLMAAAAADVAGIRSTISAASAAAAGPTSGLVAAAGDEVSAAIARLFSAFGQEYQAVITQTAAFHNEFADALAAAARAYAAAEVANAAAVSGALGALSAPADAMVMSPAATATPSLTPTPYTTLIMGGSGRPIPGLDYVATMFNNYVAPHVSPMFTVANALALDTPEGLYPLTAVKDLVVNVSVARGVEILDDALRPYLPTSNYNLPPLGDGIPVAVQGYSQSTIIASLQMQALDPTGNGQFDNPSFVLAANLMNPNGGILARFPGLTLPSLGMTFYGATPANSFPTTIYTIEYDGFADFPRYPINMLANLNAAAGIFFLHPTYPHLTPAQIDTAVQLTNTVGPTTTEYYVIPTEHLPLLTPLRAVPVVGPPIADLIEPNLRYLVNWGYGDPAYGYSTSPPNVPTPFGLFPPLSATTSMPGYLALGTQEGISAFASHFSEGGSLAPSVPSPSDIANTLSSMPLPAPDTLGVPTELSELSELSLVSSINNVINAIKVANTAFVDTITGDTATAYGVLQPTADILNASVTSVPSYGLNLFLDGIQQAVNGDPVGLVNAVGNPIAAAFGLLTVAGLFEGIVLLEAILTIAGIPLTSLVV
ncbi:PE family protein [Mycobacterium spongiae]|uniref:PE-PPE domain-containing protein n=1 Tax=Mycobacterium spongiae TaxID=886343 RepID=A0A975JZJ7_9MYCO|nr:PE-PPE domain-containing protein [Mycobacterium spongiae]QUR68612.1 PE-PPE domain-containing protein [Mycobacterium spongiae]